MRHIWNRMAFGLLVGIVIAGPTIAQNRGFAQGGKGEVVVIDYGGVGKKANKAVYYEPFEKETGIKVIDLTNPDFSKLKAMVKIGKVEWDAIELFGDQFLLAVQEGLLEPLDYKVIDRTGFSPEAVHEYGIGSVNWATVIAYNSKRYPIGQQPKTWAEFWDVKRFPGPRGLYNNAKPNLEFALLADGVPKDKLYPLNVDRAFKKLDQIKPFVKVWWSQGAQPAQLLTDGEVDLTSAWNGRIYAASQQGAPVALEWNQGSYEFSSWVVPKGAPNKANAMKFIAFASQARRMAKRPEFMPYGPMNIDAYAYINPGVVADLPSAPDNFKKLFALNLEWWFKNEKWIAEKWETWKLK